MGYGDFAPATLGARICEVACSIWGGAVTTMMIVVMNNILSLSKTQKKAYIDLTTSDPASLVIGSFFVYLSAKNNTYTQYSETKESYKQLGKHLKVFVDAKRRTDIVLANDASLNEDTIIQKLDARMLAMEDKMNRILRLLERDYLSRKDFEIREDERKEDEKKEE